MTRLTRQCSSDRWTRTTVFLTTILAVVALALSTPAGAQEARGTIAGTIRDGSGSVIPGATVTITNKEMGTTVTRRDQRSRLLPGSLSHPRHLSSGGRAAGLQEGRARGRSPHRRPARGRPRPRGRRDRGVGDGHGRHAAPRDDQRLARQRRRLAAHCAAADAPRRSVRAHRPRRRRHLHRVGPARPALRAHAHRRLRDGRDARQPQRPDDRRRAEHGDRERGRGHRVLRAAGRHRAGVQGPDRDVRRRDRQHRRRRHEPDDQVGHQPAARHGLLRQDAEGALRQRLLRQRQQHPAGGLRLQPLWRHGRRADGAARLRRPRQRPSSCTASRASTSRGRATTARRRCRPRRCATATSRSCWRSDRSIRSTTRSRAGRSPAAASSRIRSRATSSRRT